MRRNHTSTPPHAQPDWAYFLDVDGTLIELADAPDAVHVDARLLALLRKLQVASNGALALVSGRELANLEELLGDFRPPIAGLHGLERRGASGRIRAHATDLPTRRAIRKQLEELVRRYPALLLEDKRLALALHYRQAPSLASYVHRYVRGLVAGNGQEIRLQPGKLVLEIKPNGFDKGTAIAEFMGEAPFRGRKPVFIGDDKTDEHGFEEVNRMGGVSVKVGPGRTSAACRLRDVEAVRAWLSGAAAPSNGRGPQ